MQADGAQGAVGAFAFCGRQPEHGEDEGEVLEDGHTLMSLKS